MNSKRLFAFICTAAILFGQQQLAAQFSYKWMSAGSLHNFFAEVGCEIEVFRNLGQQDGLQWPAIYPYQDSQAQKGLWLACTNFTDIAGNNFPYKVVHIGPRVTGVGEFFPVKFEMTSKFDPPKVFVDGVMSFEKQIENDLIDPDLPADRMIDNVVNCQIGVTMTRRIYQFSQQFHDNYMIYEYIFENTGNIDDDPEIEMPDNTIEGFYAFFQYRYAPCRQTRYVIGNGSGWGMNTMLDMRGDGADNIARYGDPENERFRATYAWHGYFADKIVSYDNAGGPIWAPDPYGYTTEADTIGRLGAPQFIGVVTLHADRDADDETDDPGQPSTTGYYGSDEANTSNNDPYDPLKMQSEYEWCTRGHMTPRHANKVIGNDSRDFSGQNSGANIPPGGPGGFSNGNGYGPYTLKPGDNIRIVMAEAAAGLGTPECIRTGVNFKQGKITAKDKNTIFLTGRDSLFQTFRRAIANFESGYNIPASPKPPKLFEVNGGGDRINLKWELYEDADPQGFRIYRTTGTYATPLRQPELLVELPASVRSYDDLSPVRGVAHYYYIQVLGQTIAAQPELGIPETQLTSSRYYGQAYDPSFLKRPQGNRMDDVRIVPNPFIISSSAERLRFGDEESDKLAFFNIPGQCRITIYTELGEKIYTIEHSDGSGDTYWKAVTSSNQVVVSGVYIAYIEVTDDIYNQSTGEKLFSKGDSKTIKFVIIR